jgi:hypothetical protein
MPGVSAFGTTLKIGGTAGTAVVGVTSIEGPGWSVDTLDVTSHDSASAYREVAASFIDAGEVTLRLNYDPATATHKNTAGGLLNLLTTRAASPFAIGFPTTPASGFTFTALVTAFAPSAPFDGKLEANATLKITGAVTQY